MSIADIIRDKAVAESQRELCELARQCEDLFALQAAINAVTPSGNEKGTGKTEGKAPGDAPE